MLRALLTGLATHPAVKKTPGSLSALPLASVDRADRVQRELRDALAQVPPSELAAWGKRSSRLLRDAGVRRAHELWSFGGAVLRWSHAEVGALTQESRAGRGLAHLSGRWRALREGTASTAVAARDWLHLTVRSLRRNPAEAAPHLAGVVLTHLLGRGSGRGEQAMTGVGLASNLASPKALAGDILVGAALEAGLEAMIDLSRLLAAHLPADRDPLWDRLIAGQRWVEQALQSDDAKAPSAPAVAVAAIPEQERK